MGEVGPSFVEKLRLTHYPMPPSSIRVVFDGRLGPSCDVETLTVYLKEVSDPDVLEFDYRHEIEHILSHPRDVANTFKVFYYGLKRCSDKELWKALFHRFHNAACDILINHKVTQLYEGAKRGLRKTLERLKGKALDPIVEAVAKAARHSLKGRWMKGLPRSEERLTLKLFEELKNHYRSGSDPGQGDLRVPFSLRKVAAAGAELVEEGEDPDEVVAAIVAFAASCGEEVAEKEVVEKLEEAYVWQLFEWSWKLAEDIKVGVEGFRELYDLWRPGEPVERMLVRETLLSYGCIVPGHNTLKRIEIRWSKHRPRREREGANVAILLDASGSMNDLSLIHI